MKFKLTPPTSSDAGSYSGLRGFDWENNAVSGVYINDKQNSIYVSGKDFIKHGGCPETFCVGADGNDKLYCWGTFEIIE